MSDGLKIDTKGFDEVIKNLKEITPKLKRALYLDAQNISSKMEAWAKNNAVWTDQTSHARQFLKATVSWKNSDELMVSISHHVDYGVFLELCNEGKYAILEKSIAEFAPEFLKGWKEIAGGII